MIVPVRGTVSGISLGAERVDRYSIF